MDGNVKFLVVAARGSFGICAAVNSVLASTFSIFKEAKFKTSLSTLVPAPSAGFPYYT